MLLALQPKKRIREAEAIWASPPKKEEAEETFVE
jgi:hypothetical protein